MIKRMLRFLFLLLVVANLSLHSLDNIVCKNSNGDPVYFSQVNDYPQYKDQFIKYAQKHIHDEDLSMLGLQWLFYSYQNEMAPLVKKMIKCIEKSTISAYSLDLMHAELFVYLSIDQRTQIEQAAKKKWPNSPTIKGEIMDVLTGQYKIPTFLSHSASFKSMKGTQTEHQASKYLAKIIALLAQYKIKNEKPLVKTMLLVAFTKEVQEYKKGNYVFWHGRNYGWDYCSYLYKQLYNLTQSAANKVSNDYTFLRFDDSRSRWGGQEITDALYMNAYLFGNVDCWGHSTIQLMLSNDDFSKELIESFTAHYLCSQFKLETYYEKYKTDFEKLKKLHEAAYQGCGNLLMICVDAHNVDRIYSAADVADFKVPITLSDGATTTQVKKIIDDLRTGKLKDFDHLQCVLPLTKEYALDPKKGPRIYSFNATDPVKQKEFEDFGKQLFANIAADIAR